MLWAEQWHQLLTIDNWIRDITKYRLQLILLIFTYKSSSIFDFCYVLCVQSKMIVFTFLCPSVVIWIIYAFGRRTSMVGVYRGVIFCSFYVSLVRKKCLQMHWWNSSFSCLYFKILSYVTYYQHPNTGYHPWVCPPQMLHRLFIRFNLQCNNSLLCPHLPSVAFHAQFCLCFSHTKHTQGGIHLDSSFT